MCDDDEGSSGGGEDTPGGDGETAGAGGTGGGETAGTGGSAGAAGTAAAAGTAGSAGTAGTAGAGGGAGTAGTGGIANESNCDGTCGDGCRDLAGDEECDDGFTDADSCDDACQVTPLPVTAVGAAEDAPRSPERSLSQGGHVVGANNDGFVVVYMEEGDTPGVFLQAFTLDGARDGDPIEVSAGYRPISAANPVVANIQGRGYVVAWTDRTNGSVDVRMRMVPQPAPAVLPEAVLAHAASNGIQRDADLLVADGRLTAVWSDDIGVRRREFDSNLEPLTPEESFGLGPMDDGAALAEFDQGAAIAWRSGGNGPEQINVLADGVSWQTEEAPAGPIGDRPALVTLDEEHLLLAYSAGVDPISGGVSRVYYAVMDASGSADLASAPLAPTTWPFSGDDTLSQSHVTLVRAGDRIFAAWQVQSPPGFTYAIEPVLQELSWSSADPLVIDIVAEHWITVDDLLDGDQTRPALGATGYGDEGALVTAWEDRAGTLPDRPVPDVMLGYRPLPIPPRFF